MTLSDRVWKAFAGTLIPLRVFIGAQMMVFGLSYFWTGPQHHFYVNLISTPFGHLWLVFLVFGGTWMVVSALCEAWVRTRALSIPRWVSLNPWVVFMGRTRFCCYYFAGAIWGGLSFGAWEDGDPKLMDIMAPLYIVFLTWAAVNDAYQRRKYWTAQATPRFVLGP